MELRTEIKQEFLAVINGIEFNHEGIYYTVFRILSAIDTRFSPEKLPENFVEELKYAVTEKYNNDGFELSKIELWTENMQKQVLTKKANYVIMILW